MKTCTLKEVGSFQSSKEVEELYRSATTFEVRAGIIHALDKGSYTEKQLPIRWRIDFLLKICGECAREAHMMHRLGKEADPEHFEEYRKRQHRFGNLASRCVRPIIGYYSNNISVWRSNMEMKKVAVSILQELADWSVAPYLYLSNEPQRKAIGEFLTGYRTSIVSSIDLPFGWFHLAFRSNNVDLLNPGIVFSRQMSEEMAVKYVKGMIEHGETEETKISALSLQANAEMSPAVRFLTSQMLATGKLDPLVEFS